MRDALAACGCCVALVAGDAQAEDVVVGIEIVADTSTPMPGGGLFTSFSGASMNQFVVAFHATDDGDGSGLYRWGQKTHLLEQIVDVGTPIPDGDGTFVGFSRPAVCDSPSGAFTGSGTDGMQGLYKFSDSGEIDTIVDRGDPIPGTDTIFDQFSMVSHDASPDLAFRAVDGTGAPGIFTTRGGIRRVVDPNTSFFTPGGVFQDFGEGVTMSGTRLAFRADYDEEGMGVLVADITGEITQLDVIAATGSDSPKAHHFIGFGDRPSVSGEYVAFLAETHNNGFGVYQHDGQTLTTVADETTSVPGHQGNFKSFGDFTASSGPAANPFGRVVFIGEANQGHIGLYARIGDEIHTIIDSSTALKDGRTVVDLAYDPSGIYRSQVAFTAVFDDESSAVLCGDLRRVGDATGDDIVDVLDLLLLLSTWGPCTDSPADFNGDTHVDITDLLILLGAWD